MESLIIEFKVIPHDEQRYPTVGDYWWENSKLQVRVSDMGDWRYNYLVASHEIQEALTVYFRGKPDLSTEFDIDYERARAEAPVLPAKAPCGCIITEDSEPGDDRHAPYTQEHREATVCETVLAHLLGVNWTDYEVAALRLEKRS